MRMLGMYLFGILLATFVGLMAAQSISESLDQSAKSFTMEIGRHV